MIEVDVIDDDDCVQSGLTLPLRCGDSRTDTIAIDDPTMIEGYSVDDNGAHSAANLPLFGGDSGIDRNPISDAPTMIEGGVTVHHNRIQSGVNLSLLDDNNSVNNTNTNCFDLRTIEGGMSKHNRVQSTVALSLRDGDAGMDTVTIEDPTLIEGGLVDDNGAHSSVNLPLFGGDSGIDRHPIIDDPTTIEGGVIDRNGIQSVVTVSLHGGDSGMDTLTIDDPALIEGDSVDDNTAQSRVNLPMLGGDSGEDSNTIHNEPTTVEGGLVDDNCVQSEVTLSLRGGDSRINTITIEEPALIEGDSVDDNGAQSGLTLHLIGGDIGKHTITIDHDPAMFEGGLLDGDNGAQSRVNLHILGSDSGEATNTIGHEPTKVEAGLVDDCCDQSGVTLSLRGGDSGIDTITIEDPALIEGGLVDDNGAQSGVTLGGDIGKDAMLIDHSPEMIDGCLIGDNGAQNEVERLSGQNGSLRAECDDVKSRLKVAEKRVEDLEAVLFANDMKLSRAERNLRIEVVRNDKLEADFGDAKAKVKELERERVKLAKSCADLAGELKALKANNGGDSSRLHEKLLQASEDVGYWKSKSNSYSKRLKTKRKKLISHSKKIKALKLVRREHEKQLAEMEPTMADRNKFIDHNESLRNKLQRKLDAERERRERLEREIRKCLEEKDELHGVLVQYDSKLDDMAELTKDLQSEEDEDCGAIEKWKKALFRINNLCGEYRNNFLAEKTKNDNLLREITELREKLRASNSDHTISSYDSDDQPCSSSYSDDCNIETGQSLNLPSPPSSHCVNERPKPWNKLSPFPRIRCPYSRQRRRRSLSPPRIGDSPYIPPILTPAEHRLSCDIPSIELRDSSVLSKPPDYLPTSVFPKPFPPPIFPFTGQACGISGLEHSMTQPPGIQLDPGHPGILQPGESLVTVWKRQYDTSKNAIRNAEFRLKTFWKFPEDSEQMRLLKVQLYREYGHLRQLESHLGGHIRHRFVPNPWLVDMLGLKW